VPGARCPAVRPAWYKSDEYGWRSASPPVHSTGPLTHQFHQFHQKITNFTHFLD
jgi:hypothetical protein